MSTILLLDVGGWIRFPSFGLPYVLSSKAPIPVCVRVYVVGELLTFIILPNFALKNLLTLSLEAHIPVLGFQGTIVYTVVPKYLITNLSSIMDKNLQLKQLLTS